MMTLVIKPLIIGTTEILLLAGAALLIFGGKKLPDIMRNLGKGIKEFKEGVQGAPQDFKAGMHEHPEQASNEDASNLAQDEQVSGGNDS